MQGYVKKSSPKEGELWLVNVYNPGSHDTEGPFPCYILGLPTPNGLTKILLEAPRGVWHKGLLSTGVDEFLRVVAEPTEW